MSSMNYDANGYGRNLGLLIISHLLHVSNLQEVGTYINIYMNNTHLP